MEAKPKKKKSGCLITVIVLVLLGAIVAGSGDETAEPAETETQTEIETASVETEAEAEPVKETEPEIVVTVPENNPTEYTAGQYKIGADMPAGVYVLYQQDYSWMSYFAITSDANGKDILKNDNFENRSIIEVIDGEYLEINRCSAFPLEEDPGYGTVDGCLLAGSYIVGRDIAPGEYKIEADPDELAYICIYPDTRRSKIYSNDNFEGSRYVALEEGQLVEIKRGRILIGD